MTQTAIRLERIFPFAQRQKQKKILTGLLACAAFGTFGIIPGISTVATGVLLIFSSLFLAYLLLDFFFISQVFETPSETSVLAFYALTTEDPLRTIFEHSSGRHLSARIGISKKELKDFLSSRKAPAGVFAVEEIRDLKTLAGALFDTDKSFRAFLLEKGISRESFMYAASFAERTYIESLLDMVPLGKPLGKEVSIGRSLAFGDAFILERFSQSFTRLGVTFPAEGHEEEIENIISVLSKSREANAVLVGDDKLSLFSILYALEKRITGDVVIFDGAAFASSFGTKAVFESHLLKLCDEVSRAGDIILVIPDFPEFISSARTIGADVVTVLDPFLASASIQMIATSTKDSHARTFEHDPALLARFEKIAVREESGESILRFAEARALDIEKSEKVFFTAAALLTIVRSVMRFSSELVIDETDDLLRESAAKARSAKTKIVTERIVLSILESRTGVPLTEATPAEREKLSRLEELLEKRVIGQKEAIAAVSGALRRARAGVSSTTRPIGSFLFLGPTGVGKTETTKALSDIFFGADVPLIRFDMSEYNADNALSRLIGSFEGTTPGTLAQALREHEYGVILLDEFEKTDPRVIDLFLQIIDEGIFSDAKGKKVSARNHIIIATSNAGSDLIFNLVKEGKDMSAEKNAIIDAIIARAIFKPELLNRFDGLILFRPLAENDLRVIARIMLASLNKRLHAKGIELSVNDAVVDFLVKKGQDPKFGARPLNRAIQDVIESVIAKRLLEGSIKPGDVITLSEADLV